MKWRGDAAQFVERVADVLAACASKCADIAAFDRVVRACLLLDRARLPDTSDVQDCVSWLSLWCLLVATCTGSTVVPNMPIREFIRLSCALVSPTTLKWRPALEPDFGASKRAIMKAVTRRGTAAQHSYFIDNLSGFTTSHHGLLSDKESLVQQVARRGRTDVLDHLYDRGVLNDARTVSAMHSGAVEGDTVVTVQWLVEHGLLQADFKGKLVPCHKKILAYFAAIDTAAAAAAADSTV
eukprot:18536-Heterococcus_DN1.PRE.9